jgi:solute carrier family 25 (mitochondrial carnitine/acylcarnitine transporter), member 20/29
VASSFGGVSSLFRGLGAPLGSAALVNAIIFSSYGMSSRLYDERITNNNNNTPDAETINFVNDNDVVDEDEEAHEPWQKSFLCGSFAGLIQCAVICPMEHIKCRLQVQHGRGAADNHFKGPIQAISSILKSHGISGLYRGWWTTTLREVPAFGLYFTTYDYIKDNVNNFFARRAGHVDEDTAVPGQLQHSHAWLASALAGGSSGCLTWAIVYPVDVIKTRIQTSPLDTPVSFLGAGRQLVAQHGWRVMFRGLGITLVRAFPVNGTVFPVYEWTLKKISEFGI